MTGPVAAPPWRQRRCRRLVATGGQRGPLSRKRPALPQVSVGPTLMDEGWPGMCSWLPEQAAVGGTRHQPCHSAAVFGVGGRLCYYHRTHNEVRRMAGEGETNASLKLTTCGGAASASASLEHKKQRGPVLWSTKDHVTGCCCCCCGAAGCGAGAFTPPAPPPHEPRRWPPTACACGCPPSAAGPRAPAARRTDSPPHNPISAPLAAVDRV